MRRAILTAAALAALAAAPIASAGGAGAQQCTPRLTFHTTRYKPVVTRERVPILERRLGRGALVGCSFTRGAAGGVRRVSVYAVRGVRPSVAVAVRPTQPALYLSSVTPRAAERRVLDRLRGR